MQEDIGPVMVWRTGQCQNQSWIVLLENSQCGDEIFCHLHCQLIFVVNIPCWSELNNERKCSLAHLFLYLSKVGTIVYLLVSLPYRRIDFCVFLDEAFYYWLKALSWRKVKVRWDVGDVDALQCLRCLRCFLIT